MIEIAILISIIFIVLTPELLMMAIFVLFFINPLVTIILFLALVSQIWVYAYGYPDILAFLVIPLLVWIFIGSKKREQYFLVRKETSTLALLFIYVVGFIKILFEAYG